MIARLIRWSIDNRLLVVLATLIATAWGVVSVLRTPLDAIPDLSDVQVVIRTTYGVSADVADHALSGDQGSIAYKGPGYAADVFFDIRTGQSYCDPKKFRTRAYPVNVEPGTNVVKGPYVAETLAVSVESDYVVLDL